MNLYLDRLYRRAIAHCDGDRRGKLHVSARERRALLATPDGAWHLARATGDGGGNDPIFWIGEVANHLAPIVGA